MQELQDILSKLVKDMLKKSLNHNMLKKAVNKKGRR